MDKRRKTLLVAAAAAALVLLIGGIAWWESGFPLRYLEPGRVQLASAASLTSRRSRLLGAGELAELCAALRAARAARPVDGPRTLRVELATVDYGRVLVCDLGGPGAQLVMEKKELTVRSGRLGRMLARLSAELAAGEKE